MFLGRFTLGQFVPFSVRCTVGGIPFAPGNMPSAVVYKMSDGSKVADNYRLPPVDKGAIVGFFMLNVQLGALYEVGHYAVNVSYETSGAGKSELSHFEIVGGGNVNGAVISMAFFPKPFANFLVEKLDSGQRYLIKNPRGS